MCVVLNDTMRNVSDDYPTSFYGAILRRGGHLPKFVLNYKTSLSKIGKKESINCEVNCSAAAYTTSAQRSTGK